MMRYRNKWDREAGVLTHNDDREEEDKANPNPSKEDLTARELLKVMNDITPDLTLTMEKQQDFSDKQISTLDTKICLM